MGGGAVRDTKLGVLMIPGLRDKVFHGLREVVMMMMMMMMAREVASIPAGTISARLA